MEANVSGDIGGERGDGQCAWAVDARRRIGSDKCIVDVYSRFHQSEKGQSVDTKKGQDGQ